jgi:hypothetical protein
MSLDSHRLHSSGAHLSLDAAGNVKLPLHVVGRWIKISELDDLQSQGEISTAWRSASSLPTR